MTTTESEALETFRRNLQQRIDRGMSVTEIAVRSNIRRESIHRLLSGRGGITLANAEKIAQSIGSNLVAMICENENCVKNTTQSID